MSYYQVGPDTLAVPYTLFKENREKVVAALHDNDKVDDRTWMVLQGGSAISFYSSDTEYHFIQEQFFLYLWGVMEPGFYGILNAKTGKSILFIPRHPEDYAIWMGKLKSTEDFLKTYEVDECYYVDEIDKVLSKVSPSLLLTLCGTNSDSGLSTVPATFEGIEKYVVNCDILYNIIAECRVIKSAKEIEVLRYVTKTSSEAHKIVMRTVKPGKSEFQAEAEFLKHIYDVGGCRHTAYHCICGAGENSATLHYGHAGAPNDKVIHNGEMCLFDMGGNYCGYAADITCSFPANGKFTEDQKLIYNAVLAARDAVHANAKEGVSWVDMHLLANRVLCEKLRNMNILTGSIDEMMEAGINGVFQPHGLGHLIGIDVHDVGGYLPDCPPRPTNPGLGSLRTARILKAGMTITIEPGCYFIDYVLDKALSDPKMSKFIVKENLERFRNFGGVRIEDDVLITKTGCENLSIVPRTVEEIEAWMAKK